MNQAILIQHDELYGAGQLGLMLRDSGIPTRQIRLFAGESLPGNLSEARLVVLLGGRFRMGQEPKSPSLDQELGLARTMIDKDRPIIGIGYGAELLSVAGGGKISELRKPGPTPTDPPGELTPEYGWFNVNFPFPGGTEPAVFGMADGAPMFLWHADVIAPPLLPAPANPPPPPARPPTGNVVMASTRACRVQAFRFKNRVFGFQFHFELMRDQIRSICEARASSSGVNSEQLAKIHLDTEKHFERYDRQSKKLITNLIEFLGLSQTRTSAAV